MNTEQEIWRLAGEALAVQNILAGICMGLAESGEIGRVIVVNAFDYAETANTAGALKLGMAQPQAHLAGMTNVIGQLRAMALGEDGSPKPAI